MKRRTFLAGGATAVAGLSTQCAHAHYPPPTHGQPVAPSDLQSVAARLRAQYLKEFDPAYVENVIVPNFLVSVYDGERPCLPMIDVSSPRRTPFPTTCGAC